MRPPMGMGSTGNPVVPPASVPLGFLLAAAIGLVGFGLILWLASETAVIAPNLPGAVAAAHVGVLAFLTTAVLGALHQFGPVVGQRELRSVLAARITMVTMVGAAWLLPTGFAHGPESLVIIGAFLGATAVLLAAWNLSAPLSSRSGGIPVVGLRLALGYLVITVAFGVTYALDRQTGWFTLAPHRVLAHAHLGLLGWLGLTYIAVAEKLWPMFLLSHRPSNRSGVAAVTLVASGVAVLAPGLLFDLPAVTFIGGVLVIGGLGAHLTSLAGAVKHRRRGLELLHTFLFISSAFLVAAVILGVLAGISPVEASIRSRLLAGEVAAIIGWLGLAVLGHSHKIVPFISYTALRARGVRTNRSGGPLMFEDLFDHRAARVTLVLGVVGFASVVAGLLLASSMTITVGGLALSIAGVIAAVNLGTGPLRVQPRTTPEETRSGVQTSATPGAAPAPATSRPTGPRSAPPTGRPMVEQGAAEPLPTAPEATGSAP